ncbi:MAG: hypothetical protein K2X69_08880 [Silvanigrellaceae bacterium]|nr:hypothetical protein [Silvanigrellaceae bacterium]
MAIKIYFLDDETDILEIFKDTFSSNEFIITTFSNPTDLIEASKIDKPDLYFLDNKLPNFTADIVSKQLDPDIPKAIITADVNQKFEMNYIAIFGKPFRNEEILELMKKFNSNVE